MKRRLRGLVLLQVIYLTALDGSHIRLDATKIDVFKRSVSTCAKDTGAVVVVGTTQHCVLETEAQICELIKPWKKCEARGNGKR